MIGVPRAGDLGVACWPIVGLKRIERA